MLKENAEVFENILQKIGHVAEAHPDKIKSILLTTYNKVCDQMTLNNDWGTFIGLLIYTNCIKTYAKLHRGFVFFEVKN